MPTGHYADPDAISRALHEQARAHGDEVLWLGLDAPAPNSQPLPDPLRLACEGAGTHRVHLPHPGLAASDRPIWLPLNTAQSTGSHLLRLSVEHAVAECAPASLRRGSGRRVAGWFVLNGRLADAAHHAGHQMIRRRPDGRRCLLRLHDPALLWALKPILDIAQQRRLMEPIAAWWLLDPKGCLHAWHAEPSDFSAHPDVGAGAYAASVNEWSIEQWRQIDQIAALHALLRSGDRLDRLCDAAALDALHKTAMQAFAGAAVQGWTHLDDLVLYATQVLDVHPAFFQHRLVAQALRHRVPDDRLGYLLADLSEAHLSTVRQELAEV